MIARMDRGAQHRSDQHSMRGRPGPAWLVCGRGKALCRGNRPLDKLGVTLGRDVWAGAKRSFAGNGVPKLEFGNEGKTIKRPHEL
jgi:hypothetical protein